MSDIKMRGPESGSQTLSFDGQTYSIDKKGIFTVPEEAYAALLLHDFTAVGDAPAATGESA